MGRVAIVTGAGRGIGRATARALASRGDSVMAVARTEADLQALAEEIGVEYVVETVSTPEGCARIIEETRSRLGSVEILVNNAGGTAGKPDLIWKQESEAWHGALASSLHGAYELTHLASADMVERGWGRIVMVASTAAEHVPEPGYTAFAAAKAGQLGLMRAAATELGPHGVTCNAVLPGYVRNDGHQRVVDKLRSERGLSENEAWREFMLPGLYPEGMPLEPEQIAATIAFLTSEGASGINGESVVVSLGSLW